MAEQAIPEISQEEIEKQIEDVEYTGRKHGPRLAFVVGLIAALWSLFQLWIASPFPFMSLASAAPVANNVPTAKARAKVVTVSFLIVVCPP